MPPKGKGKGGAKKKPATFRVCGTKATIRAFYTYWYEKGGSGVFPLNVEEDFEPERITIPDSNCLEWPESMREEILSLVRKAKLRVYKEVGKDIKIGHLRVSDSKAEAQSESESERSESSESSDTESDVETKREKRKKPKKKPSTKPTKKRTKPSVEVFSTQVARFLQIGPKGGLRYRPKKDWRSVSPDELPPYIKLKLTAGDKRILQNIEAEKKKKRTHK